MPGKQWPFCRSQLRHPGDCDDFMEKSKVLAQITSFTLSCELPAVCECTTDKLYREGLLSFAFHRSVFVVLLCSAETRVGKVMENIIRSVCVYMWSTCKCSAAHNGCFLSKKKKNTKNSQPLCFAPVEALSHLFAGGFLTPHTQYEQDVIIVCRIVNFNQKVCRVKRSVCLHVWSERAQEVEPTR